MNLENLLLRAINAAIDGGQAIMDVYSSNFTVEHKDGKINLADLFTKFVNAQTLKRLRPAVMGRKPPTTTVDEG